MKQELPLIPERRVLLEWIYQQPQPVSKEIMETVHAPGYSDDRIEELRIEGFLLRGLDIDSHGELCGTYTISDKGKAVLLAAHQMEEESVKEKTERKKDRKYQIFTALLSGLGGVLLTLLFEHRTSLFTWLTHLFS